MRRHWWPQAVSMALLAIALLPDLPYGYYILLRWVCCGVFAYLAVQAHGQGRMSWVWILGVTAALYNPIWRAALGRDIWMVVNLVTIGVALWSISALTPSPNSGR